MKTKELYESAKKVRNHAHVPYSKFKVGSALLADNGEIYAGANVENSSYGATICAERSAISAMISSGARRFSEILVVTDRENATPPCGICRQALAEFAGNPATAKVHTANLRGIVKTYTLAELLPEAFGPDFLA